MAVKARITIIGLEEEITIEIEQNTSTRITPLVKIVVNPKESFIEGQLCSTSSI